MNLLFYVNIPYEIEKGIIPLLNTIETPLNKPLYELLDLTSSYLNQASLFVFGMDLRDKNKDSRVKIWINVPDLKAANNILKKLQFDDFNTLTSVKNYSSILIGINYYLDGNRDVRIHYSFLTADYYRKPLVREELDSLLSKKAIELLKHSWKIFVREDRYKQRFVYFFTNKAQDIVKGLVFKENIDNQLQFFGLDPYIVAFFDKEFKKTISEMNLYYLL